MKHSLCLSKTNGSLSIFGLCNLYCLLRKTTFLSVMHGNCTLWTESKYLTFTGVIDNSGIEFFYTSTRRQHEAGILTVGHAVRSSMIIPPNTESYYIVGECSADCTRTVYNNSIGYPFQLLWFCPVHSVYSMHVHEAIRTIPGYIRSTTNRNAWSHCVSSAWFLSQNGIVMISRCSTLRMTLHNYMLFHIVVLAHNWCHHLCWSATYSPCW